METLVLKRSGRSARARTELVIALLLAAIVVVILLLAILLLILLLLIILLRHAIAVLLLIFVHAHHRTEFATRSRFLDHIVTLHTSSLAVGLAKLRDAQFGAELLFAILCWQDILQRLLGLAAPSAGGWLLSRSTTRAMAIDWRRCQSIGAAVAAAARGTCRAIGRGRFPSTA